MNKIKAPLLLIVIVILAFTRIVPAQKTILAYQGRWTDGATAADGVYDLKLKSDLFNWGANSSNFKFLRLFADENNNVAQTEQLALSPLAGIMVSNLNDSGAGSLRQAILDSNGTASSDTITFSVTGTITLNSALPNLNDVTITGPGAKNLTVARSSASGTPQFRIFTVPAGKTVTISDLTITNGDVSGSGGGISNEGLLTLNNLHVTGNKASDSGGGVVSVAGDVANSTLTANNCTLSNNRTVEGKGDGLSVLSYSKTNRVNLNNCTLSSNNPTNANPGLFYFIGSVYVRDHQGAANELTMQNCTMTNNDYGLLARTSGATRVRYKNSIFDDGVIGVQGENSSTADPNATVSFGNNIGNSVPGSYAGNFNGPGDRQNVNALLTPLGDYGGQVPTHAFYFDSPAIDTGDNSNALATDARGLARKANGNTDSTNTIDVGAYERQSYIVTNTNDSGTGSLRQAIEDNNDAGGGLISFNISGAGVKTIAPTGGGGYGLPEIARFVEINGYTQSGATANTLAVGNNANLLIELSGQNLGAGSEGVRLVAAYSRVRGLVLNRFGTSGITVGANGSNSIIQGNFIGTNAAGTSALPNAQGIYVSNNAANALIGTDGNNTNDAAERNLISGNSNVGVYLQNGATGNIIAGNYIGTNAAGTNAVPNSVGVHVWNGVTNTRIGTNANGTADAAERNIIAGNNQTGVRLDRTGTSNNTVAGNYIGVDVTGVTPLKNNSENIGIISGASNNTIGGTSSAARNIIGANSVKGILIEQNANGNAVTGNYMGMGADGTTALGGNGGSPNGYGIRIRGANNNTIGGNAAGAGNLIANIAGYGITVDGPATGNRILSNSIHSNARLGIDLGENDITPNDGGTPPDADTGANDLQNFPVLSVATNSTDTQTTTISGTLASTPSAAFTVQLYTNSTCDSSGNGEGEMLAAAQTFTADANGSVNVSFSLSSAIAPLGTIFTAAATNNTTGNSSEFSPCRVVTAAPAGTLQFGSATYNVTEGTPTVTVTATRANGSVGAVAVTYSTANNTATGGATCMTGVDYQTTTGTLTWAAGDVTAKSFTVPICDDSSNEIGETFNVSLSNPTNNAALGTPNTATLTITDDDTPTITVTNLNNTGAGSLRQAITDANASGNADVIGFADALQGTINLSSALPDLTSNIKIFGPGARLINVARNSGGDYRIFHVPASGQTVIISGLTISNGRLTGGNVGGGILNRATLTINDCAIKNNVVTEAGKGGGIANSGTLTINRSTISGNAAGSLNYSGSGGGGLANLSGGIVTLSNSTVSGNTATRGGAILNATNHTEDNTPTPIQINNSTIVYNTGLETFLPSGGISLEASGSSSATLRNSIIAFNSPNNFYTNNGAYALAASCLSDNYSGLPNQALMGNAYVGTLLLGALANNGGQTDTHALLPESTGIDLGSGTNPPSSDQRGFARVADGNNDGNARLDLGAYELQSPYVVTNTADSGAGSLRQAITDSNNLGGGIIKFNIPGTGVQTINLLSALPAITTTVRIDGYSQPGSSFNNSANTMNAVVLVELNGAGAGANSHGLFINASHSRVRGLAINRFNGTGVRIGDNLTRIAIDGNYIGTNPAGTAALPNTRGGILAQTGATNFNIGGGNLDQRNVISGNVSAGVRFAGTGDNNNRIQGNFIGVAANGTTALGNTAGTDTGGGVLINDGANNTVGGTNASEANIISNNAGHGISFTGPATGNTNVVRTNTLVNNAGNGINIHGGVNTVNSNVVTDNGAGIAIFDTSAGSVNSNTVTDNRGIGINLTNTSASPISLNTVTGNTGHGININGATASNNPITQNTIAANGGKGITIFGGNSTGNKIINNSIYDNASLGIDLNNDGVTGNDFYYQQDSDTGANGLQNYPEISSASYNNTNTNVVGRLSSKANTSYTLEFYVNASCDSSGNGEGKTRINTITATSGNVGNSTGILNFNFNVASNLVDQFITATATDNVTNETSEFSQCRLVEMPNSFVFTSPTYASGENYSSGIVLVRRLGASNSAATVQVATIAGGTATGGANCAAGNDYVTKAEILSWGVGDSSTKEFQFTICLDTTADGSNETVNLALSNPSGAALGSQTTATATIYEDEFLVTNNNDNGAGSFRQAVIDANANRDPISNYPFNYVEIRFASNVTGLIDLDSTLPTLNGDVYIYGPGADVLTISGAYFTQGVINNAGYATIQDLSITGGFGSSCGSEGCGSGIFNSGTQLVLNRVHIFGNTGLSAKAGGIYSRRGNLFVTNSAITGNSFVKGGAGVTLVSDAGETVSAFFINTTLSDNNLGIWSGAQKGAGAVEAAATTGSTLDVNFENCTIAGNDSDPFENAPVNPAAFLVLGAGNTDVNLRRTLVAANGDGNEPQFVKEGNASIVSQGFNLDSDGTSGFINGANGNIVGTTGSPINALVAPLANNGGTTPTRALKVGSPAIDAGGASQDMSSDQRGQPRLQDGGNNGTGAHDIGAFELQRYTVTNANDSGAGSLRQVILDNNGIGAALIAFNIPSPPHGSVRHISLASPLPAITRAIYLDGTTQSGYTSLPLVQLDGANAGAGANGLTFTAGNSIVRGLGITRFAANGIAVTSGAGNRFTSNIIYDNDLLPIDLGNDGITVNDAGDADTGANNSQNFPVINSAADGLRVTGSLNSQPNTNFLLQFFAKSTCSPAGSESHGFVGEVTLSTNQNGTLDFDQTFAKSFPDYFITATATDVLTGDTSEYSACRQIESANRFNFSLPAYSAYESDGQITVTVQRTGSPAGLGAASVQISGAGGTATGGATCASGIDYINTPQTLTWAAGDNSNRTVSVSFCNDTAVESDETFNLALSNPAGGALGTQPSAVVTLADNGLIVTNNNDSGAGSLRAAIEAANSSAGADFISFASNVTGTIDLLSWLPTLNDVTINGPGANVLTIRRSPAEGTPNFRIFTVNAQDTAALSGLTVANGHAVAAGGIYNKGTLTLNNVAVTGNIADREDSDFGLQVGGIFNGGSLTATNCTISGNSNRGFNDSFTGGLLNIADVQPATATLTNCTISGNNASAAGAAGSGGIFSAELNGGTAALALNNCTVTGNTNAANNQKAGGIALYGGTANLSNTIVAGNATRDFRILSGGTLTSLGYNLDGDGTSGFVNDANGNIVGTSSAAINPLLGTLGDNGGQTPTHALLAGSPAIDKGKSAGSPTDQRGRTRPFDDTSIPNAQGGDGSDIGAFEKSLACSYSLNQSSVNVAGSGGSNSVQIITAGDCSWTAVSNAAWITITSSVSGSGNGTIDFSVAANNTANIRSGTITVAGQTLTVSQAGGSHSIGGIVTYGSTPTGQTAKFVSGVTLNAAGDSTISATTDGTGSYLLGSVAAGANLTVTSAKSGDVNGIESLDIARIQQYLVGLRTFNAGQMAAADVNNNGTVSSLDASRLQQYLVGIPAQHIIGQWRFLPANRQYNSVVGDLTAENYQAVLIGEISGNWTAPGNFADYPQTEKKQQSTDKETAVFENRLSELIAAGIKQPSTSAVAAESVNGIAVITASLPGNATALNGNIITIPVSVSDLANANIESFDFSVFYNSSVLEPATPIISNAGTLSRNCSVLGNSPASGKLTVSGACGNPPINAGQGTLINLSFKVIGQGGQQTQLSFTDPNNGQNTFKFNDGTPAVNPAGGTFTVAVAPTAATAVVSGRVLTAAGVGIRNVLVTMTDSNGESRTVLTSAFGYYRLADVPAGQSYIFSVTAKRYGFSQPTQVRVINDDTEDVNFIADN